MSAGQHDGHLGAVYDATSAEQIAAAYDLWADSYDAEGKIIPQVYNALTRRERHEELIAYAIEGAVQQVWRVSPGPDFGYAPRLSASKFQRPPSGSPSARISTPWRTRIAR